MARIFECIALMASFVLVQGCAGATPDCSYPPTESKPPSPADPTSEESLRAVGRERLGWKVKGHSEDPKRCLRPVPALPGVSLFGAFADDLGCTVEGFFADGLFYEDLFRPGPVLKKRGWDDGPDRRAALARAWREGVLGNEPLIDEDNGDFGGLFRPSFEPARVRIDSGRVLVIAWTSSRSQGKARDPYNHYYLSEAVFGADGNVVRFCGLRSFKVRDEMK